MKHAVPFVILCLSLVHPGDIKAQIITKNIITTPLKTATLPSATSTAIIAKVAGTPTANFSSPSKVITLPDGTRVTVSLRPLNGSTPSNFGGVVNENATVAGTNKSSDGWNCKTIVKDVNASSTTFMNINYDQSSANIMPGMAFSFDEFMRGNARPIDQGRTGITIITDNTNNITGATSIMVPQPNTATINQAVSYLQSRNSTTTGSANLQSRVFTGSNDAETSLKLSAGGGYAGFKASASASTQQNTKTKVLTIDVIKPLYTLTSLVPDSGFFKDPSILAGNKNIIVMKSVTYGTRILANVNISFKSEKDALEFKASFGADSGKGISANAQASFNYLKNTTADESTSNAYIVGGPINTTTFNTNTLEQDIREFLSRCNYSTAKPIAYSFMDVNGNSIGLYSATDRFTVPDCTPPGLTYTLMSAKLTVSTGKDNKEQDSKVNYFLANGNGSLMLDSRINNTEYAASNSKEISMGASNYSPAQANKIILDQTGGFLDIEFEPKQIMLGFDEWTVNSIQLDLNFRDQNGGALPQQISIQWNNLSLLLGKDHPKVRLPFDKNFSAGGAFFPGQ